VERRDFLKGALGAPAALGLGTAASRLAPNIGPSNALPLPNQSGIEHIIVVMMENRSFDHMLGWLPNANGIQSGLTYFDSAGHAHNTHSLGHEFMGCAGSDPGHGYDEGRVQYDGGTNDGFIKNGSGNDGYALGYYTYADQAKARPFTRQLALQYTTSDNYFCSILGPTFPNRVFQHAGATDRLTNSTTTSTLPTIWDRIKATKGRVTGTYYFNDLPVTALWGTKHLGISRPYGEFLVDAALGRLSNVVYIDPRFEDEGSGTSGDDHPHADVRVGDAFLAQIVHAVTNSPAWSKTVLVINYDEWGGFFDHVVPPRAVRALPNDAERASEIVGGKALLGMRTPLFVVSPWSRATGGLGRVVRDTLPYDHCSILKLIEWRFGLPHLTARDAIGSDVANLNSALDFSTKRVAVPSLPSPLPPVPIPCQLQGILGLESLPPVHSAEQASTDWQRFRASGLLDGWGL